MQFKREDIGLYVATALIGGGFGLLAGAFLTARINKKRNEDFNAQEAARDESSEDGLIQGDIIFEVVENTPLITEGKIQDGVSNKQLKKIQLAEAEKAVVDDIANRMAHSRQEESHRLSKEDRDELARLTRDYVVGPLQIELIEKGTMTVEELEEALIDLEIDQTPLDESVEVMGEEPINYNRQYRPDDKPDMADLLQKPIDDVPRELDSLLVTVGKWEILLEPPEGKALHQKRTIYFDPDDESVYTKSSKDDIAPADLRVIASEEVRNIIMPWLLFEEDLETIYLDDIRNKKTRWYEIIRLKKDDVDK
jgi:hypothetical protein